MATFTKLGQAYINLDELIMMQPVPPIGDEEGAVVQAMLKSGLLIRITGEGAKALNLFLSRLEVKGMLQSWAGK